MGGCNRNPTFDRCLVRLTALSLSARGDATTLGAKTGEKAVNHYSRRGRRRAVGSIQQYRHLAVFLADPLSAVDVRADAPIAGDAKAAQ